MPLFKRRVGSTRQSPDVIAQEVSHERVDPALSDDDWFAASRRQFEGAWRNLRGIEQLADAGKQHYGVQNFGTAVFFFDKAIYVLHNQYCVLDMQNRQPSPADLWIIDGYVNSLGATLALHPTARVDETVREVTHGLRAISTTCDRIGLSSQIYRDALLNLAATAPNVPVDDILWT